MATKLRDLKRTAAEAKEGMIPVETSMPKPESYYPYGLEVRLEKEELEKLGLDAGDFSVGDMVSVSGKAKVTNISTNEGENDESACVTLQLQQMAVS